uniref:Protein quiver n=1 Tax=Arion vulgaris TaxID=1028688 RepID=A0A0B6ZGR7_9EUPU
MLRMFIYFFIIVVCSWSSQSEGVLQCFQCTTSNSTADCVTDLRGMINSSLGLTLKYTKNCTTIRKDLDRCMILYKEVDGTKKFYSRDCHNGTYFPDDFQSPLFDNILPNNQTTCDIVKGTVVCYRSCNTSFCNGPAPTLCDRQNINTSYVAGEGESACGAVVPYVKHGLFNTNFICLVMLLVIICFDTVK